MRHAGPRILGTKMHLICKQNDDFANHAMNEIVGIIPGRSKDPSFPTVTDTGTLLPATELQCIPRP